MKVHLIVLFKKSSERKRPLPITVSTPQEQNGKNGVIADGSVLGNGNVCEFPHEENGHITPTTKTGAFHLFIIFCLTRLLGVW